MSWNGKVKAGSVDVTIENTEARRYTCTAKGAIEGFAAKAYPYNFECTSNVFPRKTGGFRPKTTTLKEENRKNKYDSQLEFRPKSTLSIKKRTNKGTKEDVTFRRAYHYEESPENDAFSLLLSAASYDMKDDEEITAVVTPVDRPYLIKLKVLGREKKTVNDTEYDTIKIDLKIGGRVENDGTLQTYDKLKSCTLWLSDDDQRLPLELKSEVFIGHVSAVLTKKEFIEAKK